MNKIDKSIFWDISYPLSFNCLFNFIVGARGNGKGYGAKTYATKRGINSDCTSQFGYVRRRDEELKKSAPTFFDDIKSQFPEKHFKYKGQTYYCDDRPIGYSFALSTFGNIKSVAYPNVDFIIFDEFIVDTDKGQSYLSNEIMLFLDLYETIARPATRGYAVPVFFLGNRISDINPYFDYWELETPTNKRGVRVFKDDILVQLTKNDKFSEVKKNTRFGKLTKDSDYGRYAIDNEALRDTNDFIRNPSSDNQYRFTLKFLNKSVAIYYSYKDNMYYASHKIDPNFKISFTTESTLHTEGCTFVKRKGTSAIFNHFLNYLQNSLVWYSNKEVKYAVLRGLSKFR